MFTSDKKYNNIKEKVGLPRDKKIIMFAPIFRNDGKDTEGKNVYRSELSQLEEINFNVLFEVLNYKFGNEWCMVYHFHYHVETMVNWKRLNEKYNGNSPYDMAEYLSVSDILITKC